MLRNLEPRHHKLFFKGEGCLQANTLAPRLAFPGTAVSPGDNAQYVLCRVIVFFGRENPPNTRILNASIQFAFIACFC